MTDTASARLRLRLQETGGNTNTWGILLDLALELVDEAIAGLETIALTSNYTLTSTNYVSDQARNAVLKFTGAGPFTVTIPSVEKVYIVWNACTAATTITTGSGDTVVIDTTDIVVVFCDGTNVKTLGYGGSSLKDYIASVVVGGGASLPSLSGNSGKWLTNNGTIANWALPTTTDLSDLATYTAARNAFAVAMAVAFSS